MGEKAIEKKVCDYAKSQGLLCYKFVSPSQRGVPDRIFITKQGFVFFIEFKYKNAEPEPEQKRKIKEIRDHNAYVFVVNTVEGGTKIINKMTDFIPFCNVPL